MFAARHADRSFGRNNRDHVHDKITAQLGGSRALGLDQRPSLSVT
jgi:hypothetical protein